MAAQIRNRLRVRLSGPKADPELVFKPARPGGRGGATAIVSEYNGNQAVNLIHGYFIFLYPQAVAACNHCKPDCPWPGTHSTLNLSLMSLNLSEHEILRTTANPGLGSSSTHLLSLARRVLNDADIVASSCCALRLPGHWQMTRIAAMVKAAVLAFSPEWNVHCAAGSQYVSAGGTQMRFNRVRCSSK